MDTILRDLSIIWVLIHCCIMFMMLYESRFSQKKTNIITGIFMTAIIIITVFNVRQFGTAKAGALIVPVCVIPSLILFFVMAKNRGTRFLFTFCLVDTVVLELLFITNLLDGLFGIKNYIVMFVSRLVLFPLAEFFIVKYLRTPYQSLQRRMKKGWGVFSILAALFYIIIIWTTYYPFIILERPEYISHLVLILVLVPVMYITVFKVLWTQLKLFDAAEENRALNMQVKMVNERLESSAEIEEQIKILRHDMRHKLLLISDYLKNNNLSSAEESIQSLIRESDKSTVKNYCGNHSVNVVLSYYERIAERAKIQFDTNISLAEKLPVNEMELTVILSNGLENSVNALKDCNNKRISVKCFTEADKVYLEIKNPITMPVLFERGLPKSKKEGHGYGTKSMASIVEKNEGVYCFVVENGDFVFRCSM